MKNSAQLKVKSLQGTGNSLKLIKIGQASKLLGISIDTLRRWEKKGWLKAIKTPGGTRLYDKNQLQKLNPHLKRGPKSLLTPIAPIAQTLPGGPWPAEASGKGGPIFLSSDGPILRTITTLPKANLQDEFGLSEDTFKSNLVTLVLTLVLFSLLTIPIYLLSNYLKNTQTVSSLSEKVEKSPFTQVSELTQVFTSVFSPKVSQKFFDKYPIDSSAPAVALAEVGGQVLAESTPSGSYLQINLDTELNGNFAVNGGGLFTQDLIAPNILYSVVAGENINITGDPQKPTISSTGSNDTLASVTARGATTTSALTLSGAVTLGNVLNLGNLSSDPSTAVKGATYYNTTSNKFKCYISTAWANCDTDTDTDTNSGGDITAVTVGNGLSGGGSTGALTIDLDVTTTSTTTTTSANSGLELASDGLSLLRGCSNTQVLKWNATSSIWECGTGSSGSGTIGTLAKFTSAIGIGDSLLSESGTTISLSTATTLTAASLTTFTGATSGITFNTSTATDDQLTLLPKTGGAARFTGIITSSDLTGNHTWTLPNADGTFAVSATSPITLSVLGDIGCSTCVVSGGAGSSLFTDGGTFTYLTATTDDLVLGASTVAGGSLFMDVSAGALYLGTNSSINGSLTFYSSGGATAPSISADSSKNLNITAPSGQLVLSGTGDITMDPSSSNIVANLSSTGVFNIQDASTVYWSFDDDSTVDVTFPAAGVLTINASTTPNTTTNGVIDLNFTSATTNSKAAELSTTFTSTGATTSYGLSNIWASSAVVTGAAISQTAYGMYNTATKTGADDATGTYTLYGSYNTASNTGRTAVGTVNTYGGYFDATGDASGTSTVYGVYAAATGGDNNYGVYINSATGTGLNIANTGITTDISLQNAETIDNDSNGTINLAVDATSALKVGSTGISSIGNVAHTIVDSSGALAIDSATTGAINIGTGANAKTITIGNNTTSSALALTSGTGSQTFTSSVATTGTTSSAFVLNASSLSSGTGLYLTSTSTSGKLIDLNATNTSGTIFNLAYGASKTLGGDLTGFYVDLNSGNVDATNQNLTGVNFKIPTVTNTQTTTTKTLTGMLVNFGSGAGINQTGAGGTLNYIASDLQLPALTQTAGTLNAYGLKVTTPSSITTGGTAYGAYVGATGVGAGSLNGVYITDISAGNGTEYAFNVAGTNWDAVLRVGSTTIINGSGVTQVAGGGTGAATLATNGVLYGNATSAVGVTSAGSTGQVLIGTTGGAPSWGTISGSTCTDCVLTDPSSTQTIAPTGSTTTGLSVRQTSTALGGNTPDIFNITSSDGVTKYFYVDSAGNVSTSSTSGQTLTLTPLTDVTALTLVGTNVSTQALQYINSKNAAATSGILNMAYGAAQTLTGTVIGIRQDLSTNVTAANQAVTGESITLPSVTNTITTGSKNLTGILISAGGGINQNGVGGTTNFIGADITIPALTQTAGTLNGYGVQVTTPSSITTGGTAAGINIAASGIGAGTLYGVNIGAISSAGAGTEYGLQIGSGWDQNLYFNDTTTNVAVADGGVINFTDGTNTLCTITDSGSGGTFSCGTSGTQGYWSRATTTLSPATANDIVSIANTTTTGADLAITNTGIYTGTGLVALTANSATSGDILTVSATAATSGSLLTLTGPSGGTTGVTDASLKIASDVGNIGTSNGLISSTATFDGTTATGVNLYLNSSDAIASANTDYGIYNTVSNTGALDSAATKTSYGNYTSVSSTLGAPTTAGTTIVYGQYITTTATHAGNFGTVNQYGLYVADGTSSTNGTSTKYGLYIAGASGADTNYAQYINATQTGGTIFNLSYGASTTMAAATTLIGTKVDLTTNVTTVASTGVTGMSISLPGSPAAGTLRSVNFKGVTITNNGAFLDEGLEGAAGTLSWTGYDVTIPTINDDGTGTQALTGNGVLVTTGSIVGIATVNGVNVAASGVSTGTLNGVNISSITAGAGTETAIKVGNNWDTGISLGTFATASQSSTGISIGAISSTGANNIGISLGTLTGGTSTNYQISTGALTSATTTTNAQINLGGVVTTGGTTNYGINIGALSGTGTTNTALNITAMTSTGTSTGIAVGAMSGAGTANTGISVGAVSGSTTNYGINLASFVTGSLINGSAAGGVTQTGAITGFGLDLSTNYTVPDSSSGNQTGLSLTLKNGGASATARGLVIDGTMDTGIVIGSGTNAITTGISLGSTGITTDISLQNAETIDNDSNGTINLAVDATSALKVGSTGISSIGNVAHTIVDSSGALAIDSATTGAINIGTGSNAKTITIGNNTTSTALAFTSGTGSQTFTSSVVSGTTTTSAFVFNGGALTSGTGIYATSATLTTGKLAQLSTGASNVFSSGTLLDMRTTSTGLTGTAGTGSLINLDWSPGSAVTATGDLFALNIGTNGTTTGNLFNILDAGSSIFSVSETSVTSSLPTNFTSAGDVSIAYDINFTNPTSSFITSAAPLTLRAGETFNSSNLTLQTYNFGTVLVDSIVTTSAAASTKYAFQISTGDTTTTGDTVYGLHSTNTLTGAAAKTGVGLYSTVTSSSITGDTIISLDAATSTTGTLGATTRSNYGLRSIPVNSGANNNASSVINMYGGYFNPQSTGPTTGTSTVYGLYSKTLATHAADAGTLNQYGLYIANDATASTNGTSSKYGINFEPMTAADENIALCFDCDSAFGTNTAASGIQFGNETTNTQNLQIIRTNGAAAAQITIQDEAGTDIMNGSTTDFQVNLGAQVAATAQRLCHTGGDTATDLQSVGDCDPTNADLAEYYGVTDDATEGDVVSISEESSEIDYYGGKTTTGYVKKTSSPYDRSLLGIISTNPSGEILGEAAKTQLPNPKAVALAGRVPVKVTSENGPVEVGDTLTSSATIPGTAMKATQPGQVIGKALEQFKCPEPIRPEGSRPRRPVEGPQSFCQGKIVVFVNISYADPANTLANLLIGPDGSLLATNLQADKITVSSDINAGGFVRASNFSLDASSLNMVGALASIPVDSEGKISVADALNAINDERSLALALQATMNDKLASQSTQIAQTSQIAQQAMAQSQSLDAKVASTSANLSSLSDRISELLASISNPSESTDSATINDPLRRSFSEASERSTINELTPPDLLIATGSATPNIPNYPASPNLSLETLSALDATISGTLKSLGETFLGPTIVAGDFSIDGTLSMNGNSLNSLTTLYIQNNPLSSLVDFFNGQVTINKNGLIEAQSLALGNQSLGEAIMPAGETEIIIPTSLISTPPAGGSRIFLTPASPVSGNLYTGQLIPGEGFKVKITEPNLADIKFNWLIIQNKEAEY